MQIIHHLEREGHLEEEHSFVSFVVSSLGRGPNGKIDQRRWRSEAADRVRAL